MGTINYYQISVLLIQCFLVATLLLFLFHIRKNMGIGLLFTALGLFQYMQVFLASTIYIEVADGVFVSPGSTVLFTASLFAVLLIYIKEDAIEIRKVIYALVSANIIISILLYSFGWNLEEETTIFNPYNVSTQLFENNAWVLFVGTITLLFDSILIILCYEFISNYLRNSFLRICLTMMIALSFDTICFSLASFWGSENLKTILFSGLISKNIAVIFYSIIVTFYLKFIDHEVFQVDLPSFKDVFHSLTYRQKFEIVTKEKELVQTQAKAAIQLSESRYKTLTNISPVGVFLTNAEGKTMYVNPRWSLISGLQQSDALGNGWIGAVHPDDLNKLKESWDSAFEKKEISHAEYRFLHPDGTTTWVLGQAVPEFNHENQIIGYIGTITDISEIKSYEQKLKKAKEKAEESDILKTAFLQNLSHEIRTPMNGIIGFSRLLSQPNLSAQERKRLTEIIIKCTDQLLSIITDILTISSLETMQEKLNIQKTCINNILDDLLAVFNEQESHKNITLCAKPILSDQEVEIHTDKTKVTQVLSNLLTNAFKYTQEGFIEFGYTLEANDLQFYVKDTGIGIPEELIEKIFERFRQVETSATKNYGGTGLGLSISKGFVELLDGKIWVDSQLGKGSTFYFTIPYKRIS